MGSNISNVTGILNVGQAGKTNATSKEDELKIQFAEVMSQMNTQVGVSLADKQDCKGREEKNADIAIPKDSYDKYQYRETSIKKQSDASTKVEKSQVEEKLDSYNENVKEILKEELGVSNEQIEKAMEQLGMTVIDIINPNQLANLVAELTGCSDAGELLCNGDFLNVLKEVGVVTEELLSELGVTNDELKELYQIIQEQSADSIQIQDKSEGNHSDHVVEEPVSTGEILKDERVESDVTKNDSVRLTDEIPSGDKEISKTEDLVDENVVLLTGEKNFSRASEDKTLEKQPEDRQIEEVLTQKRDENAGQQNSAQMHQQSHNNENVVVQVNTMEQVVNEGTTELTTEFTRHLDTQNIIKQIVEFTRINVSNTQTTMEMQLNPENLGKIYLEVTAKEGTVSARIVAQNEFVKEALELQLVELKQNMNQAGVKVDAVEVAVGSHEFERNLEQNEKQEEQQAEEREKSSGKMRRLNLDDLDELRGIMTEEETLVAKMMAEQGNSIDYTA